MVDSLAALVYQLPNLREVLGWQPREPLANGNAKVRFLSYSCFIRQQTERLPFKSLSNSRLRNSSQMSSDATATLLERNREGRVACSGWRISPGWSCFSYKRRTSFSVSLHTALRCSACTRTRSSCLWRPWNRRWHTYWKRSQTWTFSDSGSHWGLDLPIPNTM